ncbi:MAG: hypothetical protein CMK59_10450 [Proteobacteria bacterium]|nr:hypothetical protein [Pseudomonadota bacterium]
MEPAFHHFSDAYAWLIRGLITYGWQDLSLNPRKLPKTGFGFDLNPLIESYGSTGLKLVVIAQREDGSWYESDGTYTLFAKLGKDEWNRPAFLLRSAQISYAQYHLFVANNPLYAAGYIHDALHREIPEYIRKKEANQLYQEDLQLDDIVPEPCDQELIQYLYERLHYKQSFDDAIEEGLWSLPEEYYEDVHDDAHSQIDLVANPESQQHQQNQSSIPEQSTMPQIGAGLGLGAQVSSMGGSVADLERSAAMAKLSIPAQLIYTLIVIGITLGLLEFVNAAYTIYMIKQDIITEITNPERYWFTIVLSFGFSIFSLGGGVVSILYFHYFREIRPGWQSWLPIIYVLLLPLCWPVGTPLGIWTLWIWTRPEIKRFWSQEP